MQLVYITRLGNRLDRNILIRLDLNWVHTGTFDLSWLYDADEIHGISPGHATLWMQTKHGFTASLATDILEHSIEPIAEALADHTYMITRLPDGRLTTTAHVLLAGLAAVHDPADAEEALQDLLNVMRRVGIPRPTAFWTMALGTLLAAACAGTVPDEILAMIKALVLPASTRDDSPLERLSETLRNLIADSTPPTTPAPPTPAASPTPEPSPTPSSPETPATPPTAP